MTEPKKKKKKERASEGHEPPAPPPAAGGDPLGVRVIAVTAGIVVVMGAIAWATSRPSESTRDAARDDVRAEREERAGDRARDRGDEPREERRAERERAEERPAGARGVAAPPDVAAPPADAQRTPSGLASRVLRPGTGTRHPTETSRVRVHYTGWTTDGEMFDSSVTRGEPATFPLNRVIAGWTEGLQLMVEGEQRRLWIPEELAYRGRAGAPAGMLVFDVELIAIEP